MHSGTPAMKWTPSCCDHRESIVLFPYHGRHGRSKQDGVHFIAGVPECILNQIERHFVDSWQLTLALRPVRVRPVERCCLLALSLFHSASPQFTRRPQQQVLISIHLPEMLWKDESG